MLLQVFRVRFYPTRTIGQLYIDGDLLCFTLEDVVREVPGVPVEKWKVKNETAIPTGTYELRLEDSPKFGPETPTLLGVPGFQYVRMHSGNNEQDTEGCLILGYKLTDSGTIVPGTTKSAVLDLKGKIKAAVAAGEKVYLEIRNIK